MAKLAALALLATRSVDAAATFPLQPDEQMGSMDDFAAVMQNYSQSRDVMGDACTTNNKAMCGFGGYTEPTNDEAINDGWNDCSTPDSHGHYFTKCDRVESPDEHERLVVLGDSVSSGVGLSKKSDTWPSQLQEHLKDANIKVTNFGAGATTVLKPCPAKDMKGCGPMCYTEVLPSGVQERSCLAYWDRPQMQAFQKEEWDHVMFMFGNNDAKGDFWPKECNDMNIETCPFAQHYLELIQIAKSRGRNGKEPQIYIFMEGNPNCCSSGTLTCHDDQPGCGYCMKCAGDYDSLHDDGTVNPGTNAEVRIKIMPQLVRMVAEAANVPLFEGMLEATKVTPVEQCAGTEGFLSRPKPKEPATWWFDGTKPIPNFSPKNWHHWPTHCTGCRGCHPAAATQKEFAKVAHKAMASVLGAKAVQFHGEVEMIAKEKRERKKLAPKSDVVSMDAMPDLVKHAANAAMLTGDPALHAATLDAARVAGAPVQ